MKLKRTLVIGGELLAVAFLLFLVIGVWPTMYRYDVVRVGSMANQLVRTNRFTGNSQLLSAAGWRPLVPWTPPQATAERQPDIFDKISPDTPSGGK